MNFTRALLSSPSSPFVKRVKLLGIMTNTKSCHIAFNQRAVNHNKHVALKEVCGSPAAVLCDPALTLFAQYH